MRLDRFALAAALAAIVLGAPGVSSAEVNRLCLEGGLGPEKLEIYRADYAAHGMTGSRPPMSDAEAERLLERCAVSSDDRTKAFGIITGVFLSDASAHVLATRYGIDRARLGEAWAGLPEDGRRAFRKTVAAKLGEGDDDGSAAAQALIPVAVALGLTGDKADGVLHLFVHFLGLMTLEMSDGRQIA